MQKQYSEAAVADGDACLLAHRVLSKHPQAVLQGIANAGPGQQQAFIKQLHGALRAGAFEPRAILNAVPQLAELERLRDSPSCPSRLNADGVRPLLPTVASYIRAPQSLRLGSVCRTWYAKRALLNPLRHSALDLQPSRGNPHPPMSQRPPLARKFETLYSAVQGRLPRAVGRGMWALGGLRTLSLDVQNVQGARDATSPPAMAAWRHLTRLEELHVHGGLLPARPHISAEVKMMLRPLEQLVATLVRANSASLLSLRLGLPSVTLCNLDLPRLDSLYVWGTCVEPRLALCNVRWPKLMTLECWTINNAGSADLAKKSARPDDARPIEGCAMPLCVARCFAEATSLASVEFHDPHALADLLAGLNCLDKGMAVCELALHVPERPRFQDEQEWRTMKWLQDVMECCLPAELKIICAAEDLQQSATELMRRLPALLASAASNNQELNFSHPGIPVTAHEDGVPGRRATGAVHRFSRLVVELEAEDDPNDLAPLLEPQVLGVHIDAMRRALGQEELRFEAEPWEFDVDMGCLRMPFVRKFE